MPEKEHSDIFSFEHITCAPIVHSRYYFALHVQKLFDEFKPQILAVEFPHALRELILWGVRRLPSISVVCSSPDSENYSYIPIDPCDALIHAIRIAMDRDIPIHFVDLNRFELGGFTEHYTPDDYALPRIGMEDYYLKTMETIPLSQPGSVDYMREQNMAARLRHILSFEYRTLFVCGMVHWERVRTFLRDGGAFEYFDLEQPEADTFLANLHPDSVREVLEEIPAVAGRFETMRASGEMDRNGEIDRLISAAAEQTDPPPSLSTRRAMAKYLRNLSLTSLQLTPDLVDLLTAAKDTCGNEFAVKLMEVALEYPWFTTDEDLPVISIRRGYEQSDEGRIGMKKIKLSRRQNMTWKRNLKRVTLRRKPPEKYKNEWRDVWNSASESVSYPPEDIRLEDYNTFVRERTQRILSEEKTRTVEFTTSILDGIDLRETIRNSHTGKIFVRDVPFIKGRVGPVTIIFDEDHPEKYPWRTAWYSEHKDESDLIMYTTPPGLAITGPGISECRFGGYTSIFPPNHVFDFWRAYPQLTRSGMVANFTDLLLFAAINYAEEKYIAYVGKSAPSPRIKQFAASQGRHIVFIPISNLSPSSVEKLSKFHVLGSRRLRSIAHRYIF